jgi:hypothetical protein
MRTLDQLRPELLFRCQGDQVTVSLNGQAIPCVQMGNTAAGALRIGGDAKSFRIFSMEYRPLP